MGKGKLWAHVQHLSGVQFFTRAGYRCAVHDGPARWVGQGAELGCRLLSKFQ